MPSHIQALALRPAVSYRRAMPVKELMIFPDTKPESSYYVCPRCKRTMEREFSAYCDRCGQHLDWTHYENAAIVYPGQQKSRVGAKHSDPTIRSVIKLLFIVAL